MHSIAMTRAVTVVMPLISLDFMVKWVAGSDIASVVDPSSVRMDSYVNAVVQKAVFCFAWYHKKYFLPIVAICVQTARIIAL